MICGSTFKAGSSPSHEEKEKNNQDYPNHDCSCYSNHSRYPPLPNTYINTRSHDALCHIKIALSIVQATVLSSSGSRELAASAHQQQLRGCRCFLRFAATGFWVFKNKMKESKFNSPDLEFFTFYWLILVVLLNGNRYLEHLSGLVRGNGEILSQVVSSQARLKSSLVWNSETNGNQASMATDLTGDTSGLGPFELEALQDYEYKFMSKYVKVGSIKKEEVLVADSESTAEENEGKCNYSV
ncbi:hypothetical protein EZV62_007540 [Acer yangbiense]|uniref:Uncharacterized protein n=1 Tax=Acer yangbiense TaxID=1000413 RepID=A0A5C7IAK2_9ROSI|nr:hypothetical protein EZV62_007540 [Acer yangbiense]